MNQLLIDDLYYWFRKIQPCDCCGMHLTPVECYKLGLVIECAHSSLLQLRAELEIERSNLRVLDPEGSRLRMALHSEYGAPFDEKAPRGARGRSAETEGADGKPAFRNL